MNLFVNALKATQNLTHTENGALTYKSTTSRVLDLFASGGALRQRTEDSILQMIRNAVNEDQVLALRTIFYLRDVRGGQGERRTFRLAIKDLATREPELLARNLHLVPFFGRWDDLFVLEGTKLWNNALDLMRSQLAQDLSSDKSVSLLAKWLPSENASSKESKRLAKVLQKAFEMNSQTYRRTLTNLRQKIRIVESKMCAQEWTNIEYSHVPSRASMIYRDAFKKHDPSGYEAFLNAVEKGEKKINASTLYPYDIVKPAFFGGTDSKTLDLQWAALPDYFKGKETNGLVMADVSGSMNGLPMCVSISLAMYIAERNKGVFNGMFMTFSGSPEIQKIEGKTVLDKVNNLSNAHWTMNTNLQAAFDKILELGVRNRVPQNEMPDTLYIVSDMEFDTAVQGRTNFQVIKSKYQAAGYEMPRIVFWNVNSRNNQQPITLDEQRGVYLVSGCSPSILETLLSGKSVTAVDLMLEKLNSERYARIN